LVLLLAACGSEPDEKQACERGPAGAYLPRDEYCATYECPSSLSALLAVRNCTQGEPAEVCYASSGCPIVVYSGCGKTVVQPKGPFFSEYFYDSASGTLIGAEVSYDMPVGRCMSNDYYWGAADHAWEQEPLPLKCGSISGSTCSLP